MSTRILIVEDDVDIRESLVELLAEHGYDAISASHGQQALDMLTTTDDLPCLIVLDLMMPVMDGREFRGVQLEHPALSRIPIVVMSALREIDAIAAELRANAVLRKPLRLEELLFVVRKHCVRHQEV